MEQPEDSYLDIAFEIALAIVAALAASIVAYSISQLLQSAGQNNLSGGEIGLTFPEL